MTMHNPSHPGEMIREEVIGPLGLEVSQAAKVLQVARSSLSRLLNERAALSPEMAIRIERAFGPNADHLMRIQTNYDMTKARQSVGDVDIQAYEPAGQATDLTAHKRPNRKSWSAI